MSKSKLDELLERVEQNNWDDEHTRKLAAIVRDWKPVLEEYRDGSVYFIFDARDALARAEQIAGGTDETR